MRTVSELERADERAFDKRAWLLVAAAAVLADVAGRGLAGVGAALLVAGGTAGLIASSRLRNWRALALALAAPLFGLWLAVRATPWLRALDLAAAGLLILLAAALAAGGNPLDLTARALARRCLGVVGHLLAAPAVVTTLPPPTAGAARQVRGVALAAPLVVVLGLLLGSADPVFASFFDAPAGLGDVAVHVLLLAAGAWAMAGLLRAVRAAEPERARSRPSTRRLGPTETTTILASLVGLYAAFAVSQVVVAAGGARHVLETQGLTYAEYARSGFFQLLAVATITLVVLVALRPAASASGSPPWPSSPPPSPWSSWPLPCAASTSTSRPTG